MKHLILFFTLFFLFSLGGVQNNDLPLLVAKSVKVKKDGGNENKKLGRKALTLIVREMKNPDSDIRMLSCEILGKIGNKAATKILINSLQDVSKHVQISAAEALHKFGEPAALKVILDIINDAPGKKPIANTPLLQMKEISKNKIRESAIEAIVRLLDEDSRNLLYNLKIDNYPAIRDVASRELAMLGDDREMRHFIYALESKDEPIRYEAALSLSKICSSDSIEPVKIALKRETSMRVKIAILDFFLCVRGRKSFMEDMLKLSSSRNATIRFKSTLALANIKNKKVLKRMQEVYSSSQDLGMRLAGMKGLIKHGKTLETGALNSALASGSPELKLLALDIIKSFDRDIAIPLLRIAMENNAPQVRLEAAHQVVKRLAKKRKKK